MDIVTIVLKECLHCRGPGGLSFGWVDVPAALPGLRALSLLCAGCGLGDTHLRPSQLKALFLDSH